MTQDQFSLVSVVTDFYNAETIIEQLKQIFNFLKYLFTQCLNLIFPISGRPTHWLSDLCEPINYFLCWNPRASRIDNGPTNYLLFHFDKSSSTPHPTTTAFWHFKFVEYGRFVERRKPHACPTPFYWPYCLSGRSHTSTKSSTTNDD